VYTPRPDGFPRRIAALPVDSGTDGPAVDPAGRALYVTSTSRTASGHHLVRSGLGRTGDPVADRCPSRRCRPRPCRSAPTDSASPTAPGGSAMQQGNAATGTGRRRRHGRSHPPGRGRPARHRRPQLPAPRPDVVFAAQNGSSSKQWSGRDRGALPKRHVQARTDQRGRSRLTLRHRRSGWSAVHHKPARRPTDARRRSTSLRHTGNP
jgi:hypothetical protein